jgi:hypothetical protein
MTMINTVRKRKNSMTSDTDTTESVIPFCKSCKHGAYVASDCTGEYVCRRNCSPKLDHVNGQYKNTWKIIPCTVLRSKIWGFLGGCGRKGRFYIKG